MEGGCKYCGSGKGEMFLTNPPFHKDRDQCVRYLRVELSAVEKRASELEKERDELKEDLEKPSIEECYSVLQKQYKESLQQATHYKELLKLAAPILDAVDDAAKRVRFTELHGISSLE